MFCDLPSPSFLHPDLKARRGRFLANTEPGDFFDRFSPQASLEFPQGIRRIWELLRHLAFFYSVQSPPLRLRNRRGEERLEVSRLRRRFHWECQPSRTHTLAALP